MPEVGLSLVSMITYAEQHYGGDANRVYVTGSSSGGMMTDEMLALYPDVFKAGAAFMGVPFDCFANAADYPPGSSKCTGGTISTIAGCSAWHGAGMPARSPPWFPRRLKRSSWSNTRPTARRRPGRHAWTWWSA